MQVQNYFNSYLVEKVIKQMLNVADQADDLEKGSKALERINSAISGITDLKFDGGDININKFAEDLVSAVPAIEKAIMRIASFFASSLLLAASD